MKKVIDQKTRKYDAKDLFFDAEGNLMMLVKEAPSEKVNLMKDLKAYFGDNDFNLTATMKTEDEVDKPHSLYEDEEEDSEE